MNSLSGKRVLVTGGSGSIGSKLVDALMEEDPHKLRFIDNDESRLFELKRRHQPQAPILETNLANIRNTDQVVASMKDIDVVFHAAALKHVGLVEQNPYAAVETNVIGTKNIVDAAAAEGVESLVAVSTDKASTPISTMGATKLIAERLTLAMNDYGYGHDTRLACVRFGNVLGSRGSVIPLFLDQLVQGQPLTVTDESMTRFLMTPDEAAAFVVEASQDMRGGEVFVKKMPAFRLGDLVGAMRDEFAPRFGVDSGDVEVERIGAQPGERLHEKLISKDELRFTEERNDRFVLVPNYRANDAGYDNPRTELSDEYTSAEAQRLSKREIIEMIESVDVEALLSQRSREQGSVTRR